MKHKTLFWPVIFVIMMFSFGLILSGCSDDDPVSSHGTAPEIPPQSTFLIDFDDFNDAGIVPNKESAVMTSANYAYSALNVAVWNTALTVTLIVPVAAFVEAFQHEPVWRSDDSWDWSYSFLAGGAMHTARLNGKVDDATVIWKMYITKQDAFTDFLWFTGQGDLGVSTGQWILNMDPETPTAFMQIDWNRNASEGTADVKYTNIIPEDAENGGYIFYGVTNDVDYDRFYEIYNKGLDNITDIEWNYTTKVGRVMDEYHFGDADWYCWDEALSDVLCIVK